MAVQETSESYKKLVEQAANKVREVLGEAKVAIVLGSGLGNFVSRIKNPITLSYNEVLLLFFFHFLFLFLFFLVVLVFSSYLYIILF